MLLFIVTTLHSSVLFPYFFLFFYFLLLCNLNLFHHYYLIDHFIIELWFLYIIIIIIFSINLSTWYLKCCKTTLVTCDRSIKFTLGISINKFLWYPGERSVPRLTKPPSEKYLIFSSSSSTRQPRQARNINVVRISGRCTRHQRRPLSVFQSHKVGFCLLTSWH